MTSSVSLMYAVIVLVLLYITASVVSGQSTESSNSTCSQTCESNKQWLCSILCTRSGSNCDPECRYVASIDDYFSNCQNSCSVLTTTETITTQPPKQQCGVARRGRIVGGSKASECEFPWAVMITIGNIFCGGTILNPNTVLTAGHCVFTPSRGKVKVSSISVRYGSSYHMKAKTADVIRIDLHPRFLLRYFDFDVALLRLDQNLTYSACVQPICLPEADARPDDTLDCMAIGWGAVNYNRPIAQRQLRKVSLPIVPLSQCQSAYSSKRLVTETKLCAGDLKKGGVDSCLGDSGGPLMCYREGAYHQYGVVSFGRACANPGSPGVYSRVSHDLILSWIRDNM